MEVELKCPECGGAKLIKWGKKFIKGEEGTRILKQQYQCRSCGRITMHPEEIEKESK